MPGFESRLCSSCFLLARTLGGSSDGLKRFRSCWLLWGWGFPLVAGADGRVTSRSYKGGLCASGTREGNGGGGLARKPHQPREVHLFADSSNSGSCTRGVFWRDLQIWLCLPHRGPGQGRPGQTGSSVKVLATVPCAQCGAGGSLAGVPLSWLAAEREAGGCFSSCDSRRETSGPRSVGQALFPGGRCPRWGLQLLSINMSDPEPAGCGRGSPGPA